MSREQTLMDLIKLKYRSVRNFSIQSGIPNSTLSSMFKKGIGGTSVDTVLKVCSLLDCDIYSLTDSEQSFSAQDQAFFSDFLKLSPSSKELVKMITAHQLKNASENSSIIHTESREIEFPIEKTLSMRTIKIYTNSASAGFGEYLDDSDYDEVDIANDVAADADFGITIHGDSMMPEINDGDVVWVRQQDRVEVGQIGVFILNGNALCKKLVSKGREFFLRSLNQKYSDIAISEYDTLKVIGRVINTSPYPSY